MTLLSTHELTAFYGDFQALFGVDVRVGAGEVVAVIGANGAGKTTLLRSVTGQLSAPPDAVVFDGRPIGGLPAFRTVGLGIAVVPEGRHLFPSLSVEENLRLGGYSRRTGPWTLERVYGLFPRLRERRHHAGSALSGGEQQMTAIGRALMANPRLLLCDEVSLGLAPLLVKELYAAIGTIQGEGTTLLVVEQDIGQALKVADRVYCIQKGRISLQGAPAALTREQIRDAYFGL